MPLVTIYFTIKLAMNCRLHVKGKGQSEKTGPFLRNWSWNLRRGLGGGTILGLLVEAENGAWRGLFDPEPFVLEGSRDRSVLLPIQLCYAFYCCACTLNKQILLLVPVDYGKKAVDDIVDVNSLLTRCHVGDFSQPFRDGHCKTPPRKIILLGMNDLCYQVYKYIILL